MDAVLRLAAVEACRTAAEKRGTNVLLLDLRELSAVADYFILITARSRAHARGLAQALEETLDQFTLSCRRREGYPDSPWILLDYEALVIHIFLEEERDYYGLERLWGKAPTVKFEEGMPSPPGIFSHARI